MRADSLGGRGVLPRRWSLPMEPLSGIVAPNSAGPQAGDTGSPTQDVVTTCLAPTGDGSVQRRGRSDRGDGESCPGSGRCVQSAQHRGPTRWGDGEPCLGGGRCL